MITCRFESGADATLRHVVVNIIVCKDDQILLVKRAPHMINSKKWALPGGFLDRNETLETAVKRELQEETGYEGKIDALLAIIDNPQRAQEDRQNVAFIYISTLGQKVDEGDNESSEVRLFFLNQLPPKEEFAFDHYSIIQMYREYLNSPQTLPLVISQT